MLIMFRYGLLRILKELRPLLLATDITDGGHDTTSCRLTHNPQAVSSEEAPVDTGSVLLSFQAERSHHIQQTGYTEQRTFNSAKITVYRNT
jgi:hypothetical protein